MKVRLPITFFPRIIDGCAVDWHPYDRTTGYLDEWSCS